MPNIFTRIGRWIDNTFYPSPTREQVSVVFTAYWEEVSDSTPKHIINDFITANWTNRDWIEEYDQLMECMDEEQKEDYFDVYLEDGPDYDAGFDDDFDED